VNPKELRAKTPSPRTGLSATLRARLHAKGTGAPSRAFAFLLALLAILALTAAPALANSSHVFSKSFGEKGSGAGQLSLAAPVTLNEEELVTAGSGVAVNDTTHDVYVADTGNHRIDEFESDGSFVRAWGWGVADGVSNELQTCTLTCFAGLSGSGPGEFEAPTFIAVDNDPSSPSFGAVYVGDTGDRLVTKFDSSGSLVKPWGTEGQIGTTPIVVATGTADLTTGSMHLAELTATSGEFRESQEISGEGIPAGTKLERQEGALALTNPATVTKTGVALTAHRALGPPAGIAIDTSGNLWFYATNSQMFEFQQAGGFIQNWGGPGAQPAGIAIDGAQSVYLDGSNQVQKLTSGGGPIGVLTGPPTATNGVSPPTGLAVDQLHGDVYVDTGKSVEHISRSCSSRCPLQEAFGSPQLSAGAGLAVDSSSAAVYAADAAAGTVDVFAPVLEVETGPSSGVVTASSATVTGAVNPEGSEVTRCVFEYGTSEEYGQSVPCAETVGSGTGEVAVHADLKELQGGTTYHYRLLATNLATNGKPLAGEDRELLTLPTPVIANLSALNVTESSADLIATVNPVGLPLTACQFQYGTSTSYGLIAPCAQTLSQIGAGTEPVPVSAAIGPLAPNTTYHWRLLASDVNGSRISPDQTFVDDTAGAALPDGRRYELVTPVQKNGALIGKLFISPNPDISEEGSRVIAPTGQCFPGAPSCVGARQNEGEPYEFLRTSGGWQTHPLAPPATSFETNSYWSINANADTALFSVPGPPAGQDDFYARPKDGSFTRVGPLGEGAKLGNYENLTKPGLLSTADLSHVVYQTEKPAWAFDETKTGSALYEYAPPARAEPLLVGVSGETGSHSLISTCGTALGDGEGGSHKLGGSLSEDGRTVLFTAQKCESGGSGANEGIEVPARELYARIDGEEAGHAHTMLISGPTPETCETKPCEENTSIVNEKADARDANFEGASTDGSRVLFTDTQQLTDGASQDPSKNDHAFNCAAATSEASGCNLYEWECPHCQELTESEALAKRRLIDVSADPHGGPRVQGTLASSPDGTHVYFVAKGVLSEAPNAQGQSAHGGAENLYVYERDPAYPQGRLAFIAALSPSDEEQWNSERGGGRADVTPEGRFLLFTSRRALTADDSSVSGVAQVFRYDAQSAQLLRVSVGQAGFNDNGNAGIADASIVPPQGEPSVPQRSDPTMSHDGSYVFFKSPVGLTPQALNDVQVGTFEGEPLYAQNVYEYHDGNVSLISDGKDVSAGAGFPPRGVELLGSDASGSNVFFSTADQLVPQDTDTQLDIYDAHICSTGQPCIVPAPQQPPPCEAEACHGTPPGAPAGQAPASESFTGPGNLTPPPPPKAKTAAQIRAAKLAKALKACRTKHNKHKRAVCEKHAKKLYGKASKAKRSNRASNNRRASR
jgi:hypothetical protein